MSKIIASLVILAIISSTMCKEEGLKFLAEEVHEDAVSLPIHEIENFMKGFYSGLNLFNNLTHQDECFIEATDPEIVNSAVEIYRIFQNLTLHSDFTKVVKEVSEKAIVVITKIGEAQSSCARFGGDLSARGVQIVNFLKDPEYIQKITTHTYMHITGFIERVNHGVVSAKDGDFHASGYAFGDLINFGFFWNFNQAKKL